MLVGRDFSSQSGTSSEKELEEEIHSRILIGVDREAVMCL